MPPKEIRYRDVDPRQEGARKRAELLSSLMRAADRRARGGRPQG